MGNILNLDQLAGEMLQTLSKALRVKQAVLLIEEPSTSTYDVRYYYPEQDKEIIEYDSQLQRDWLNLTKIIKDKTIEELL